MAAEPEETPPPEIAPAPPKPLAWHDVRVDTAEELIPVRSHVDVEREERRAAVMRFYHVQKMTQKAIATALQISQGTVSKDLAWIAANWRDRYGVPSSVDPTFELGEAAGVFDSAEREAMLNYATMRNMAIKSVRVPEEPEPAPGQELRLTKEGVRLFTFKEVVAHATTYGNRSATYVRTAMACLHMAQEARKNRINLLQDIGLLERQLGTLEHKHEMHRAVDIQDYLRDQGELEPVVEGQIIGAENDERVERWLNGEIDDEEVS